MITYSVIEKAWRRSTRDHCEGKRRGEIVFDWDQSHIGARWIMPTLTARRSQE
jgi:hypothetical protein